MSTLVDLDPFSEEFLADPYPFYDRLLSEAPVHWVRSQEFWMVTGYDQVASVLRNPAVYSSMLGMDALFAGRVGQSRKDLRGMLGHDMSTLRILIATDPPDHTRLRRLVSRAFTPKAIGELEPRLREICDDLVEELVAKVAASGVEGEGADLVRDLAIPFPVTVIAELLGIPPDRRDDFRRWSDASVGALSGDWDLNEAQVAGAEMMSFMAEIVEQRRAEPQDDLISRLVAGGDEDAGDGLSFVEITLFAILLLVAGNETTTNLIGNAAAALSGHPDQAERLRTEPALLPSALEEVLRWDCPVQGLLRGTTRATTLAGVDLAAGDLILVSFAAANRDPARFDDPGRFDISRRSGDHFAFGHGIHFCLGASLARLEARLVGECLLRNRMPLDPAEGAVRTNSFILRGFTKYPLRRSPAQHA